MYIIRQTDRHRNRSDNLPDRRTRKERRVATARKPKADAQGATNGGEYHTMKGLQMNMLDLAKALTFQTFNPERLRAQLKEMGNPPAEIVQLAANHERRSGWDFLHETR